MTDQLTRRAFFALPGTGLFLMVSAQEPARLPARQGYPTDFNAYLRIAGDGKVTCFVGKVELGQGSMTALAQLLAEELDVPCGSVDMVMGDTDRCPWDMGTFGSLAIRQFGPVLRAAGAEARAILLQLAGEHLEAPAERLQVKAGVVTDPASDKRVTYGQLVEGKRIERHVEHVPVKPVKAFTVIGRSEPRKDGLDKITGKSTYAGDVKLPGMLHARLVRPPAHGATLKAADTSEAEKIPGVRIVKEGGMIAVLHEHWDVAESARELIKVQFERPAPGPDDKSIFEHLLRTAPPAQVVFAGGNLAEGEQLASGAVERTYLNAYVAHAPIETHTATAAFEGGKVTIWSSTQAPFSVKNSVAQALGMSPQDVRIITPYVGGGFGGKSASLQSVEAARLAKITGRPVQVVWDRGEEFFYDTFRPAAVVKIKAGVTKAGKLAFWNFEVTGAGDREARTFYEVAHQRTTSAGGWGGGNPAGMHPFAVGPWRAPSVNTNTFARESHMDMLAEQAGMDPVEFRLNNLSDARMRRVLEAAAKQFGWKPGRTPSRRGVGVACGIYAETCVATCAEVAVDAVSGRTRVKRVVIAQDNGVSVNPEGLRQQLEGCITMGLGYALSEEVRFRNGEVLDRNFDSYQLPRFSWLPKIETVLIENPDTPALGSGEPPIITMGAVIANAIYDAVGARVLELPITPERVLRAAR